MISFPIKRLYVSELISQSVAIYPLYAIMFGERSGLTLSQVGLILGLFSITTIVAEVPTGAIADRFSRKWSLILSKLMLAAAMVVWLFWPGMTGYCIGIVLMGFEEALYSGAMQSYLYEQLADRNKEFAHINARLWAMMMAGWTVGAALAALVGPNYRLLLILSVISPLIGAAITASLPSDRLDIAARHAETGGSLLANTKAAAHYIFSARTVLYAVLSIVSLKLLVDVLIEYIPLYYKGSGVSTETIPLLFFVGNAITIGLFWFSRQLSALVRRRELAIGTILVILLLITSQLGMWASILGMFWYVRVVRMLFVTQEGEIQHLLIDRHRATVTSIYSMITRLLMALSLVIIGRFAVGSKGVVGPILVFVPLVYLCYALLYRQNRNHVPRSGIEALPHVHPTA
ncbi:MAG: MFS transporter [Candidatus Saccharibacteria bacterium]|nr:MFS transporter [Candidatus Saccharibacteria bacterium]